METFDITNPRSCICSRLRGVSRSVTQFYENRLRCLGLRPTQLTLLMTTAQIGQITITDLAERMAMDRTTLSRNLKPLEKQGLVEILPGADRRTRQIGLTPKGRKTLSKAMPLWEQAQKEILEVVGEKKIKDLMAHLGNIAPLIH